MLPAALPPDFDLVVKHNACCVSLGAHNEFEPCRRQKLGADESYSEFRTLPQKNPCYQHPLCNEPPSFTRKGAVSCRGRAEHQSQSILALLVTDISTEISCTFSCYDTPIQQEAAPTFLTINLWLFLSKMDRLYGRQTIQSFRAASMP